MKSKWNKSSFVLVFCLAFAWSAFASGSMPEAQQPAHRSTPVHDLRATRKGDKITLTWSQPSGALRSGVTKICRSIAAAVLDTAAGCAKPAGEVNPSKSAAAAAAGKITLRFTDTLPEDVSVSETPQFAIYTVELTDDHGRSAGVSNAASVPLAPVLSPRGLHFQLDVRGVYLIWENEIEKQPASVQFDYRIYRREKGASRRIEIPFLRGVVHMSEGDRWSAVDTNVEWEKTYTYWVTPVTKVYSQEGKPIGEIAGEDSEPLEIALHDVFPPAVPENLLAIVSEIPAKKYVDLLWAPNLEKDLAGYNVYRREGGTNLTKLNPSPITMLSFHDENVVTKHKYFYAISAIDKNGNESAKSQETTEVLP